MPQYVDNKIMITFLEFYEGRINSGLMFTIDECQRRPFEQPTDAFNAFAADIGAIQDVIAQQRPFEQPTDAFSPTGRQTESEKNLRSANSFEKQNINEGGTNWVSTSVSDVWQSRPSCPDSGGKISMRHGIPFDPTTLGGENSNYIHQHCNVESQNCNVFLESSRFQWHKKKLISALDFNGTKMTCSIRCILIGIINKSISADIPIRIEYPYQIDWNNLPQKQNQELSGVSGQGNRTLPRQTHAKNIHFDPLPKQPILPPLLQTVNKHVYSLQLQQLPAISLTIRDHIHYCGLVIRRECAGVIKEVGSDVKDLVPGDRLALEPGISCRRCTQCKEGRYNLCPEKEFFTTPPVHGSLANQNKNNCGQLCSQMERAVYGEVFDPCTVITIGVFDKCHLHGGDKAGGSKDSRIVINVTVTGQSQRFNEMCRLSKFWSEGVNQASWPIYDLAKATFM
ncbi:Alcohol dehydrogenase, C-terminal [Artemisia annua]|uniref:Alcohol dehydrogenase, C-terminal n=1 Tax=Artemisia annua TaxID=35608 RepID=A0A2U1N7B0_ARTAN|nr:Alcohol dehydrogenase, C-terminal [Artemisia annua]